MFIDVCHRQVAQSWEKIPLHTADDIVGMNFRPAVLLHTVPFARQRFERVFMTLHIRKLRKFDFVIRIPTFSKKPFGIVAQNASLGQ